MLRYMLVFCMLLFLSDPATGAGAATPRQKLIIGGDHDCPPYEFLENGRPTGFDIELMRAVADVMGFTVEFRLGPWSNVRQELEQGSVDALAGMYYSEDRSRLIDFSVPHTLVTSGIFVRKDSPIRSFAEIQGKEVIVQEGDIMHDSLTRSGLASRIVTVTDAGQALKFLASGKHDCAIMPSRLQGEHYVNAYSLTNIRIIKSEFPSLQYCFAVRKGNRQLLYQLDEGLKILTVNGKYREIYEKWFGVYERKNSWHATKHYLFVAVAIIGALFTAGFAWTCSLRRQVRIRTAELRESEEKFRVLAETIPAGIVVHQGEDIVYLNPAAVHALGCSEQVCLKMNFWDMVHDDFKDMVRERGLARQRGAVVPGRYEYKWIGKGGEERWALLAGARIEFKGKPAGIASLIDITDLKRAEESLRVSEEKFRVLAETSPAGICLYQDERIVYVNPATTQLFGYSEEECLQMSFWDWVHEDSREMARERGLARMRGEPVPSRYECRHVGKDGRILWIHISAGLINYGGKLACIVTFFDITDRKRMEEELQLGHDDLEKRVRVRTAELARTTEALAASEQEKSLILNITDAHVMYFDPDMNILWANRAAGESVRMTPEELRKRHCWEVWHQREEPCPGCPVLLARDSGEPQQAEVCTPAGRIWFVRAYPVRNESGKLMGMVEFTQDFTERKRMEEQLRQKKRELEILNDTLERRVEEEVEKNREKDIILIQQNRQAALGEMLDHIAHQWKQPLSAISFIIMDLEESWSCGGLTDEQVADTVGKTRDLVGHMAQTIDVFRDFYRPDKEKTSFSVKDSIDKALSFISTALRFHGITLRLDIDPTLAATGYPKEYAQVLLNIMTNARDVFLERKTEKPMIEVKAFQEGTKAVVTITDNAGGIPGTIVDMIFDLYYTTRESSGGTGVGLYMSKNIIEKSMGGKLSAANVDGGAQFRIELNVANSVPVLAGCAEHS